MIPNTLLSPIFIKSTNILTTIITADAMQFLPWLSLNQRLKILEFIKNLILGPQKEYQSSWEWSSIKATKKSATPWEFTLKGPQKSECTNFNRTRFFKRDDSKKILFYLPAKHWTHLFIFAFFSQENKILLTKSSIPFSLIWLNTSMS